MFQRRLAEWVAFGPGLLWRLPLLLLVMGLALLYGYRGLVHLAFLFVDRPVATFLFAPVLLPAALMPVGSMLGAVYVLPPIWRDARLAIVRRALIVLGGVFAAWLLAGMLDLIFTNLVKLMGIRLPRLPLDVV